MKKVLLAVVSLCLCAALVLPFVPAFASYVPASGTDLNKTWINPFKDVKETDWFYSSVKSINELGLMDGTEPGYFSPSVQTSRAMLITILWRMAGSPAAMAGAGSTEWYSQAKIWAVNTGISDGEDMNGSVTREQAASMIYRFEQKVKGGGFTAGEWSFNMPVEDAAQVSDWAREGVYWCYTKNVVSGVPDELTGKLWFFPAKTATRSEIAAMLTRYAQLA